LISRQQCQKLLQQNAASEAELWGGAARRNAMRFTGHTPFTRLAYGVYVLLAIVFHRWTSLSLFSFSTRSSSHLCYLFSFSLITPALHA
jgi:hypothetical protein